MSTEDAEILNPKEQGLIELSVMVRSLPHGLMAAALPTATPVSDSVQLVTAFASEALRRVEFSPSPSSSPSPSPSKLLHSFASIDLRSKRQAVDALIDVLRHLSPKDLEVALNVDASRAHASDEDVIYNFTKGARKRINATLRPFQNALKKGITDLCNRFSFRNDNDFVQVKRKKIYITLGSSFMLILIGSDIRRDIGVRRIEESAQGMTTLSPMDAAEVPECSLRLGQFYRNYNDQPGSIPPRGFMRHLFCLVLSTLVEHKIVAPDDWMYLEPDNYKDLRNKVYKSLGFVYQAEQKTTRFVRTRRQHY